MTAPKGLGPAGKGLWKAVHGDLPSEWELDHRELELLGMAARQADDLALLEQSIKKMGALAVGAQGQTVVNPAIGEARQARHAISRLLGAIQLPDSEEKPSTARTTRARHAAQRRWSKKERAEGMAKHG